MSQNNDPEGYRGELRDRLIRENIRTWSKVKVKKDSAIYEGLLLPRSVHTDDDYITLKVDTGYNLGILVNDTTIIEEIGYQKGNYKLPHVDVEFKEELPNVTLLGTGGTVASMIATNIARSSITSSLTLPPVCTW